jgi:sugar lactone lactonase YvrE
MSYDIRIAYDGHDGIGEGPVWDERRGELLRAVIDDGLVCALKPETGEQRVAAEADGELASVVLCDDGSLVTFVDREIRHGDEVLAVAPPGLEGLRFNDCRVDPLGRIWAGTMTPSLTMGAAQLYRLDAPGEPLITIFTDSGVSNGIAWTEDRMYYSDTLTHRVDVFDWDGANISNRRPFATLEPPYEYPDGLCLDAEGGVWLACYFSGSVLHFDPDGKLDEEVKMGVTNPTCPTFGGTDLRTLYVTSATHLLSDDQLAADPHAGAVLAFEPGVAGLPANRFGV